MLQVIEDRNSPVKKTEARRKLCYRQIVIIGPGNTSCFTESTSEMGRF